jgi:hypothetical protein
MRAKIVAILMVEVIFVLPSMSRGATVNLPRTGQTTCYDTYDGNMHLGAPMPCNGTGQDGEIQEGVGWPTPRFTDNGDGAVTDALTGLMWLKDGNCISTKYPNFDANGEVNWQQALDFVNGINSGTYTECGAGYTDWHLPNMNELQTLLHAGFADSIPWLESRGFTNVNFSYWTSTTQMYPNAQDDAWWVELDDGTTYTERKTSAYHLVWPVRVALADAPALPWRTGQTECFDSNGALISCTGTGQDGDVRAGVAWPTPRFRDNGNGTVTDKLTGLMWLKDATCLNTHYSAQVPNARAKWQDALAIVAGINDGTYGLCGSSYTDWRLPNRKEIQSLLDYSNYTPALPDDNLFINLDSSYPFSYWTSTSSGYLVDDPNFKYAWYVSLHDGMVDNSLKNWNPRIWPVRGPVSDSQALRISMPWIPLLLLDD